MRGIIILLLSVPMFGQVREDTRQALNAEALKQGLHWKVACVSLPIDEPGVNFFASAFHPDHSYSLFAEDGGWPGYGEFGATQQEASEKLLKNMRAHQNIIYPDHSPIRENRHRQCPPPVEGGK